MTDDSTDGSPLADEQGVEESDPAPSVGQEPGGADGVAADEAALATRAVSGVLVVVLLTSLVGVGYVALTPQQTAEPYTEFYALGPDGLASDCPTNLAVGERGEFRLGVINREHRQMEYTVVLVLNGTQYDSRTLSLADGATFEDQFDVTPTDPGRQRLQILLYRGSGVDRSQPPYRRLRLWINVTAR